MQSRASGFFIAGAKKSVQSRHSFLRQKNQNFYGVTTVRTLIPASLVAALALAGCAATSAASYQSQLTALAAGVPVLEAALATYPGLVTPAVSKAESDLNAALAALQASPAPTSASTVLADIRAVAAAMPPNVLSPAHQAELSAALALAQVIAGALAGTPTAS